MAVAVLYLVYRSTSLVLHDMISMAVLFTVPERERFFLKGIRRRRRTSSFHRGWSLEGSNPKNSSFEYLQNCTMYMVKTN